MKREKEFGAGYGLSSKWTTYYDKRDLYLSNLIDRPKFIQELKECGFDNFEIVRSLKELEKLKVIW